MTDIINRVKQLTHEELLNIAVKYLMKRQKNVESVMKQHNKNRAKYNTYARTYYYKKNDIYHPELNPNGMIEKKFKRQLLTN